MSQPAQTSEKRSRVRLARHTGISWQLNLEEDRLITKNISDISPAGMSFKAPSSADIAPGQFVSFTLSVDKGESFECKGQIVWVKKAEERKGAMKQYGVRFMKLPARLDAAITKAINENQLQARRREIETGTTPRRARQFIPAELTVRSVLPSILGGLLVMALTAAFLFAVWMHEQTRPEDSIARKFDQGIERKVSAVPDDLPH